MRLITSSSITAATTDQLFHTPYPPSHPQPVVDQSHPAHPSSEHVQQAGARTPEPEPSPSRTEIPQPPQTPAPRAQQLLLTMLAGVQARPRLVAALRARQPLSPARPGQPAGPATGQWLGQSGSAPAASSMFLRPVIATRRTTAPAAAWSAAVGRYVAHAQSHLAQRPPPPRTHCQHQVELAGQAAAFSATVAVLARERPGRRRPRPAPATVGRVESSGTDP